MSIENIIAISYFGGMRGEELARVISFSPECYDRSFGEKLRTRIGYLDETNDAMGIIGFCNHLGITYNTIKVFNDRLPEEYCRIWPRLRVEPNGPFVDDAIKAHRYVVADHILASDQRAILPSATVIGMVSSDVYETLTHFFEMNLKHPGPDGVPHYVGFLPFDSRAGLRKYMRCCKRKLRMFSLLNQRENVLHVDSAALRSVDALRPVYFDLMHALKLTPNWEAVEAFMQRQERTQPPQRGAPGYGMKDPYPAGPRPTAAPGNDIQHLTHHIMRVITGREVALDTPLSMLRWGYVEDAIFEDLAGFELADEHCLTVRDLASAAMAKLTSSAI